MRKLHESGANISLVVDSINQMQLIDDAMKKLEKPLRIIIEMDMSLKILNDMIHLGVRRSPVRTIKDLQTILRASHSFSNLKINGVMCYDAAVAGLTDNNPFKKMLNPLAHGVRKMVAVYAANLRAQIPAVFREAELPLNIFNAGGTGSINYNYSMGNEPRTLLTDTTPTELTIGSGLLCSSLFDCYSNLKDSFYFEPSLFFALQVTRTSDPNYVTCFGGGYIASGEPGWDRVPTAVLPKGLALINSEACGEVQTPLIVNGKVTPLLGQSVLFRPAKTGELAERFNKYLLLSNEQVVDEAKTYRGYGKCF